jgi:hypothetical protein
MFSREEVIIAMSGGSRVLCNAMGLVTLFGRNIPHKNEDGLVDGIKFVPMRKLRDGCSSLDLIHIFGVFIFNHPLAAVRSLAKSVPVVVSPMAHLMPNLMAVNRLKKYAFLKIAWTQLFKRVSAFHVFSEIEACSVRKFDKHVDLFEGTSGVFPGAEGNVIAGRVIRVGASVLFSAETCLPEGAGFSHTRFRKCCKQKSRPHHPIVEDCRIALGRKHYLRKTIRQLG